MGNYLIKNVVQELLTEFPRMHQFSSLSPIPGFRDWLMTDINKYLHQQGTVNRFNLTSKNVSIFTPYMSLPSMKN